MPKAKYERSVLVLGAFLLVTGFLISVACQHFLGQNS
jgi:hypothetical protein